MAYGMEAVLPLETLLPIARTEDFDFDDNTARAEATLDFTEELRDNANLAHVAYQQEVAHGYNHDHSTLVTLFFTWSPRQPN